jgi:hypothetical protein
MSWLILLPTDILTPFPDFVLLSRGGLAFAPASARWLPGPDCSTESASPKGTAPPPSSRSAELDEPEDPFPSWVLSSGSEHSSEDVPHDEMFASSSCASMTRPSLPTCTENDPVTFSRDPLRLLRRTLARLPNPPPNPPLSSDSTECVRARFSFFVSLLSQWCMRGKACMSSLKGSADSVYRREEPPESAHATALFWCGSLE